MTSAKRLYLLLSKSLSIQSRSGRKLREFDMCIPKSWLSQRKRLIPIDTKCLSRFGITFDVVLSLPAYNCGMKGVESGHGRV